MKEVKSRSNYIQNMYGQHRKIKSQNVKPLELKDSKEAGKWHSEKAREKTVL